MALLPWLVVSRVYGEVVPVLDDGTGPMEYGCDVVFVEAETRSDAVILGVHLMRTTGARFLERYDDECPFSGVKAILQSCPSHGTTAIEWRCDKYECRECEGMIGLED